MPFCVVLATIGEQEDNCRSLFHGRSRMSAVAIVLFAYALQWCGQRRRVAGHGWLAHAGRQFLVTENDCLWNMNIGIMHPTTMPNITSTVSDPLWKKRATYSAV